MSTENTKFETFWTALENCPYDLPVEIKPHLLIALKGAGFFDVPTVSSTGNTGTTVTKTKKLSGYNVFMKEKMAMFKAENVPSGERMSKVGALWKTLSEEEKAVWKAKAAQVEPVTVTVTATATKSTGPKKLSGYQLYVKETMPIVKVKAEIPAKERMAEIGKMWKALKDEEKAAFKVKAEQLI